MNNKILMLVAVAATAGLIMAFGCGGQALMEGGTVETPGGSVPVEIEVGFVTGDVGSTTPVTKDLIDDCNLGLDGDAAGSPENVTATCTMSAVGNATVPGGLVPLVSRKDESETPAAACVAAGETPSNCITWLLMGTAGNCYLYFSGYTYSHPLINSEYIPISMSGDFEISWGPAINLETAAVGVKGDALNLTATLFNELFEDIDENVPTPAIDWSQCAGILDNATDPFAGTPYANMVSAHDLKYRQSATLLQVDSVCTISVTHSAEISLNGTTSGTVDFYRDPFKVSAYIVDDIADPKVGLDGFYSASNFTYKDSAGNALLEGGTNNPTSLTVVAGANMEFSASQISSGDGMMMMGTGNISFTSDISGVRTDLTFDYSEPIGEFSIKIDPVTAVKLELSNDTYSIDDMVVYDTVNNKSLQQDVIVYLHTVAPPAVASDFYKASLDSAMNAFTRPVIANDAVPPTTVIDQWIDSDGINSAKLVHDPEPDNNLYTFTDATNHPGYEADRWTKEDVYHISGPLSYSITLDLLDVANIITDNDAGDTYVARDLVWESVTSPSNDDAAYVIFVMAEDGATICGAMTMELVNAVYEPTSGGYKDCSADDSPIVKVVGTEIGMTVFYNGLELTEANGGHEYRDWEGDDVGGVDPDGEVLTLKPLAGFASDDSLQLHLIIASQSPGNMTFKINGFYNGGWTKVGQIPSPGEFGNFSGTGHTKL